MTLTEVVEDVAAAVLALGFRRSESVFSVEQVPDSVQHLAFLLFTPRITGRPVSGAIEWAGTMLELRVAYLVGVAGEAALLSNRVMPDVHAIFLALLAKTYLGAGEWLCELQPDADAQCAVMSLQIPLDFCEPTP